MATAPVSPQTRHDEGADIFLSYAREDISVASELARELEKEGWSVWWDREIHPGQDFELVIDLALAHAKAVVVLWSVNSVASTWVRNEAKEAQESNKLIPVLVDKARIPLSFRALSTLILTGFPDRLSEIELSLVKMAIKRVIAGRGGERRLEKPAEGDAFSLSVRVASRVADLVRQSQPAGGDRELYLNQKLTIERCIADVCFDLLTTNPAKIATNSRIYFMKLGTALQAKHLIVSTVDYATLAVTNLSSVDEKVIPSAVAKKVLQYVNDHCVQDSETGLDCIPETWPENVMLCLPCPIVAGKRDFVWFLHPSERRDWEFDVQDRLLLLSQALHAIWENRQ